MYIENGKYRYKLIDDCGYDISESEFRKIKISELLEHNKEDIYFDFYISLQIIDEEYFNNENLFWNIKTKILLFKGIKIHKETLDDVSTFIDEIKNYKVFPIYLTKK